MSGRMAGMLTVSGAYGPDENHLYSIFNDIGSKLVQKPEDFYVFLNLLTVNFLQPRIGAPSQK